MILTGFKDNRGYWETWYSENEEKTFYNPYIFKIK